MAGRTSARAVISRKIPKDSRVIILGAKREFKDI